MTTVESPPASIAESSHSSILQVTQAKASKLKSKLKSRLHKHDGSLEDDEEEDDDDIADDVAGESEVDRVLASSSAGGPTPAQAYAAQKSGKGPDGVVATDFSGAPVAAPARTGAPGTPGRGAGATAMMDENAAEATSFRNRSKSSGSLASNNTGSLPATQSNWKREAEFHNLFDGITESEQLVSDYSSAWAKDILRHGRLYVGAVHLAFSCGIIGLKAHVVIAWSDITKIEKAVTARVIPNAISVTTSGNESYLFSSFAYRDVSYDLILECWKNSNPSGYSDFVSTQLQEAEATVAASASAGNEDGHDKGVTAGEAPFNGENSAPATHHSAHEATDCSGNHYKEIALDVRFPSEPEKIYNLLYRDDAFIKRFCETQSLTDLKISPWEPASGLGKRTISYTKPLSGSVGPSSATCQISEEELAKDASKAYELLAITKTPEVPSGGSFQVETKTCLTWAGGSKGGCRMVVTTECVWKGRSMIKGIVTNASIAGQRQYNKDLAKAIRAHIHQHAAEFGSGDTNAPEADDELTAEDDPSDPSDPSFSPSAKGAGSSGSFLGSIMPSSESSSAIGLLAISNVILFILVIVLFFRSRSSVVKVQKTVMSPQIELDAISRLSELESRWTEFRKCVDALQGTSQ